VTRLLSRLLGLAGLALCLTACNAKLPDPQSPGAVLYKERCNGCHRIYAPGSMKPEMWRITLDRMQGQIARNGGQPLSAEEYQTVLAYLQKHSSP
jgi:cytochrome c2